MTTQSAPTNTYDVIVIGAGHAGCEAALAAARMGCRTLVVTPNVDRIGFMPCNPSIGGPGKSQIVAEVDALGGAMARVADMTNLQARELNTRKGPAVRAIRLQCDKSLYAIAMKEQLELQPGIEIVQDSAGALIMDGDLVGGVVLSAMGPVRATCVVVTAGTFLRARMISGEQSYSGGRAGDSADGALAPSLADLGLRLKRFKTGTPPRLDARSLDVARCEEQPAHDTPLWLSREGMEGRIAPLTLPPALTGIFSNPMERGGRTQLCCYLTSTNAGTHEIIRANLDRAPMYNGSIEGTGPRYCPSIEDKVGRFAHKDSHPIYIEPEGWRSHEVYIQGLSTSLPADIQQDVVRSIVGMEDARITRFGYAVEYDALDATELTQTLECRRVPGLFFAGQVNGTSGYEEAAGQGIIAGANAAARALSRPPMTLDRTEGYIGVMIDDLITQQHDEPYRMLTSRAEYRLILRSDTADARLAARAHENGLIEDDRAEAVRNENEARDAVIAGLDRAHLGANPRHADALTRHGIAPVSRSMTGLELARRPDAQLGNVIAAVRELDMWSGPNPSPLPLARTEVAIRYAAFIDKEEREADRQHRSGSRVIPADLDFLTVTGLRVEAQQKLNHHRPLTVGQASRTPGVTPGDIGALLVFLTKLERKGLQSSLVPTNP